VPVSESLFHFLRPAWLWGYLPLTLAAIVWWRQQAAASAWRVVVDAELAPHMLEDGAAHRRRDALLLFLGWALALLILAGPVRERQSVEVFEARRAQVVLFDLSRSMLADDVAPSRLARARFKLADLIKRSGGVRTGLVGFAERPYAISPLTDDAATLEAFVSSLDPEIMPAQGSRVDLALTFGGELLAQAGVDSGHVILFSDADVTARDAEAARALREQGHVVSVLAVGTPAGAPLRGADGKFLRDRNGGIVVAQLDRDGLADLAGTGGGVMVALSSTMDDIDSLLAVQTRLSSEMPGSGGGSGGGTGDDSVGGPDAPRALHWVERAPLLIPLLALLALGFFRRGVVT